MKAIISAIIVVGALSQMASAMGLMGDTTHRHFYKDQEWIWQSEQSQPTVEPSKEAAKFEANHVWELPSAFVVPAHPSPLAFVVPTHPSLAFVVPAHPSLAFVVPAHPSPLAFVVPAHPSLAFVVPAHPSPLAFVVPAHPQAS
jgi:tRNA A37 threonylcarbamoyladenosine synthetase subunit TsaC/SUA5/YrdC